MNGLEALEIIRKTTDLDIDNQLGGYRDELEIIQNDLEVLTLLKELLQDHLKLHSKDGKYYVNLIAILLGGETSERVFNLLKGWLERE